MGDKVKISSQKYSQTTSKITNRLKALAVEMGYSVEYVSEKEIYDFDKFEGGGEVDILALYKKNKFSEKDSELIDEAIENGDIDTDEIKEDCMDYIYERLNKEFGDKYTTEQIWEYTDENLSNGLTHKENYDNLIEFLESEDEYAEGGEAKKRRRRANAQTGRTDRSVDKTRVGKPVGYRFSNSLASKLRKDKYAVPTEKQITKYLGKGIYKENRKNRSDKDKTVKL
jgi:polyhydroxyalkanoate synthesis regulator phasin